MRYFDTQAKKQTKKEVKRFALLAVSVFLIVSVFPFRLISAAFAAEADTASSTEPTPLTEEEKEALRIIQEQAEKAAAEQRAAEEAKREADALREKINSKNSELEQIQVQIDSYKRQADAVHGETKTLQNTVQALDTDRQKMSSSIKLTENRLESTNLNIDRLGLEIVDTENKIISSMNAVAEVLRATEQSESRTMVETILSKNNLSEIMDESFELTQFRDKVTGRLNELKKYKTDISAKKAERENERKKLSGYKVQLVDQKIVLDNTRKEQKELLSETRNKESNYRKLIEQNMAKKEAFEKELFEYESKLKRQIDQKFIPETGSKILVWPLDEIKITQHFGRTKDSVRLYASGTHNGMDFRASRGTPVKSPSGGTVIGTGDTDKACPKGSYGKWVLIRHNNGLSSLLAHLDLIKVAEGQSVSVGDIIGYSGNTGYSTGPHLHMTLFASEGVQVGTFASKACSGRSYTMPLPTAQNAYLDPEAYF
ncbi:MAG: peptidoglycan DD-metalloendopeptidase family protein [Parcubacteria group bacterium]|nr:peptidoglycan DD-metalloendopeptidase family protein [Parcubacteria group bacterium]